MANDPLRGCPLCGTRITDVDLGLRDYRWLKDALPGRVAPMDVDFMLERKGSGLVLEYKPPGAGLPMGQRLTLKFLVRLGVDVWIVWHKDGETTCEVGAMDKHGGIPFVEKMTVTKLRRRVTDWYYAADREVTA